MRDKIFQLLQFLPLIIFLAYTRGIDAKVAGMHWKGPFLVGASLALVAIIVPLLNKVILNRILLGINAFFISGAVAFLFQFMWLLDLYWKLKSAPMFIWVTIVGVIAILFNQNGFIGIHHSNKRFIRLYSIYLLLATIVALGVSLVFRGIILISDVIPFIALFVIKDLLKSGLAKKVEKEAE